MIKATLQTPHFEFEAYGPTVAHATNALKRGLAAHAVQYKLKPDWWDLWADDIQTQYFDNCKSYRNGKLIR